MIDYGLVRHVAQWVASAITTYAGLQGDVATAVTGIVLGLATLGWYWYDKKVKKV